jgi:undecaprenyl-diphosphatase
MPSQSARRDPWPWIAAACALAFLILTVVVAHRGGLAFDEPLATTIKGLPIPVGLWIAITFLGGAFLVPLGAAFVLGAALGGRVRLALIVAAVLIVATFFTDSVKDFIARPRPPGEPLVPAPGYSFPSGHALNSTATYGLLALVAWRSRLPHAAVRAAVVVGLTLPVLVGLSRIALGVHWPSDVLGGWLAGVAFVAIAATFVRVTGAMERDTGRPAMTGAAPEPDRDGDPGVAG